MRLSRPPIRACVKPRRPRTRLQVGPLEDRSLPATLLWTGGDGNFSDSANWTTETGAHQAPTAGDDALILTPGVTVTSSGANAVRNLTSKAALNITGGTLTAAAASLLGPVTLSGGTLTGTGGVTVNGSMTWTGGTVAGGLRVAPGAALNISGATPETLAGTLTNEGTVTWDGAGDLQFSNGVVQNNTLFRDLTGHAATVPSGAAAFHNAGTYDKTTGAGTTSFAFLFDNPGTLKAEAGTLQLNGGVAQTSFGSLSGGTWFVGAGATLTNSVSFSGNQADVTLAGPGASFTSLDNISFNSGTLTLIGGASFTTGQFLSSSGRIRIGAGSTLTADGFQLQSFGVVPAELTFEVAGRPSVEPAHDHYGRLVSTGSVSFNGGGSIRLTLAPGVPAGADPVVADAYTLITSTGSIGALPPVVQDVGDNLVFSVAGGSGAVTATAIRSATNLAVTAVTPPAAPAAPGADVTIGWTVKNTSLADSSVGSWTDAVYVSAAATFDDTAVLVGTVPHNGTLAAGATYDGTYTGPLPGLLPGTYHVFVVTDFVVTDPATNALVPDPDRTNNVLGSAGTFTVTDATALTLGVAGVPGTVAAGRDVYYKVDAPGGTPLQVTVGFGGAGQGEVYVDYRRVPTTSAPAAGNDPTFVTQQAVIPTTQAGTYYIRVHGTGGGAFTIGADTPAFGITKLGNTAGSNRGSATLTIHGFGFTPNTKVSLVKQGTTVTRAATKVLYVGPDTVYATFNLAGLAASSATVKYDVKVTDGANITTVPNGYTVTTAPVGSLVYHTPPASFPVGVEQAYSIDITNTGGTDVPVPLLLISGRNFGFSFRLPEEAPPANSFDGEHVYFLPTSTDAPAGIIPAGYHGTIRVLVTATNTAKSADDILLEELNAGRSMFWSEFKGQLRPSDFPLDSHFNSPAWDKAWANFLAAVGGNTDTYVAALRDAATYLAAVGTPVRDEGQLLGYLLRQAAEPNLGPTLAEETDASIPTPGLALDFTRGFLSSVKGQYTTGRLGGGWVDNWDISVAGQFGAPSNQFGNIIFRSGTARARTFVPVDNSPHTTYRPDDGGEDVLTFDGTRFVLTDHDGAVTAFLDDGRLEYLQAADGTRVTAGYDATNRLTSLTHSNGQTLFFAWNTTGQIASVADRLNPTDPTARVTKFTYSGGQLTAAAGPLGTTRYAYAGKVLSSITVPGGLTSTFSYDSRGRLSRKTSPGGSAAITYTYGPGGGVTATDAAKGSMTILPDFFGRITSLRDAAGHTVRFTLDADGQTARTESAAGQVWTYARDDEGRVVAQTDPLGHTVRFAYQGDDLAAVTDARGNTTSYQVDALGRPTAVTYPGPNGGTESFAYDATGGLVEKTNRRGHAVRYLTNSNGQVARAVFADGTATAYTYDARGNLLTVTDLDATNTPTAVTTLAYDLKTDRVTKVTYPNGKSLAFTYDTAGRRATSLDQDGFKLTYAYDSAGRLNSLRDTKGVVIVRYTYNPAGRLIRKDDANGTYVLYTYDPSGQLVRQVNHGKGTAIDSQFDYTYDVAGRVATMTTGGVKTTYGYDLDGQLVSVVTAPAAGGPATRTITYAYDAAGNRTSMTDNGVTTTYTVNELNQVTATDTGGVGTTYTYDADGNRLTATDAGGTTTYAWDDLNRLTGVDAPGTANDFGYTYDAFGSLFTSTRNGATTINLNDPVGLGNLVAQYNSTGLVARYVHGLGLEARVDPLGGKAFYEFDKLGSVVGVTSAAGAVVNRYSYLPFGETTATPLAGAIADNPFTFVGEWGVTTDGSGLVNMRARRYDATLGGFVSDDPLGFGAGQFNVRGYVGNDPVNNIDPTGLKCTDDEKKKLQEEIQKTKDHMKWAQGFVDYYNNPANFNAKVRALRELGQPNPVQTVENFRSNAKFEMTKDEIKLGGLQQQLTDCDKEEPKPKPTPKKRPPDKKFASPGQGTPGVHPVKKN